MSQEIQHTQPLRTEEWEALLFPEVSIQFATELAALTHTLASLSLKSTAQAITKGYVCIRAAVPWRKQPSLWVAQDKLAAVQEIQIKISRIRRGLPASAPSDGHGRALEAFLQQYPMLSETEQQRVLQRKQGSLVTEEALLLLLAPARLGTILSLASGDSFSCENGWLYLWTSLRLRFLGEEVVSAKLLLGQQRLTLHQLRQVVADDAPVRFSQALGAAFWGNVTSTRSRFLSEKSAQLARLEAWLHELYPTKTESVWQTWRVFAAAHLGESSFLAKAKQQLIETMLPKRQQEIATARSQGLFQSRCKVSASRIRLLYSLSANITLLGEARSFSQQVEETLPANLVEKLCLSGVEAILPNLQAAEKERAEKEQHFQERVEELAKSVEEVVSLPFVERAHVQALLKKTQGADFAKTSETISGELPRLVKEARERGLFEGVAREQRFQTYADFFTTARSLSRKWTFYVGPTNSGKTFHALNALAASESGVYLSPLRLLALEGQEELEKRGHLASYLTGEERELHDEARFLCSTIEMLGFAKPVQTAVIDEIQLLTDPGRGWAWTAALMGAPAENIVMTGSADVLPLVQTLADQLGEPLEVKPLQRFNPLRVKKRASEVSDIGPGTALICFSRRDCLTWKRLLEERFRVAVIYGNLSPQVRREEARRFRSGEAEILVATDAIAMGLNLPIHTVLFTTVTKFNGKEDVQLSPQEVLQIGGRAGRYGKAEEGFVGALQPEALRYLQQCFSQEIAPTKAKAQVKPSLQHVLALGEGLGTNNLWEILKLFQKHMRFDSSSLVVANLEDMLFLATHLDREELVLRDKFLFSAAPVEVRVVAMMSNYLRWVRLFAAGREVPLENKSKRFSRREGTSDPNELYEAEVWVKTLTLYAWLSYRFPESFVDLEFCEQQRAEVNAFIEKSLRKKAQQARCRKCAVVLPPKFRFPVCDGCFHRKRHGSADE